MDRSLRNDLETEAKVIADKRAQMPAVNAMMRRLGSQRHVLWSCCALLPVSLPKLSLVAISRRRLPRCGGFEHPETAKLRRGAEP